MPFASVNGSGLVQFLSQLKQLIAKLDNKYSDEFQNSSLNPDKIMC